MFLPETLLPLDRGILEINVEEIQNILAKRFVAGTGGLELRAEILLVGIRLALEDSLLDTLIDEVVVAHLAECQVIALGVLERVGELEDGVRIGRHE